MNNVAQGAAVLAVLFTTKNEKMKSTAAASGISALLGITEPAMFGITLRLRYPFIAAIIGSALGSAYLALRRVLAIALGAAGLPGIISIRPESWVDFIIGLVISMTAAFILTIVFQKGNMFAAKDTKKEETKLEEKPEKEEVVYGKTLGKVTLINPVRGEVENIEKSVDQTFASKMMGEGLAITPTDGKLYAPMDCKVESIFQTGHAVTLSSKEGVNILIHIGVDTVNLEGKGFNKHVKDGDELKAGDLIIDFDRDYIKSQGLSDQTMVVIMDSDDMEINFDLGNKDAKEKVMEINNA